jgi:hypothetical protein
MAASLSLVDVIMGLARSTRPYGGLWTDFHTRLSGALTLTQTPKCHMIFEKSDGITAWHLTRLNPEFGHSFNMCR